MIPSLLVIRCPVCEETYCTVCSPGGGCGSCLGMETEIRTCCDCRQEFCGFCSDPDYCSTCRNPLCDDCSRASNRDWRRGSCTPCAKGEPPVEKELPEYPQVPLTPTGRKKSWHKSQALWLKERRDWWQAEVDRLVAERDEAIGKVGVLEEALRLETRVSLDYQKQRDGALTALADAKHQLVCLDNLWASDQEDFSHAFKIDLTKALERLDRYERAKDTQY